MAFLVQVFLPLYDNDRRPFSSSRFVEVRRELTEQFGGVTAFTRAPAEGFWEDAEGRTHRDDVIIVEVMTETLDRDWWKRYGAGLAARFAQDELVVRAMAIESLSVKRA